MFVWHDFMQMNACCVNIVIIGIYKYVTEKGGRERGEKE